MEYFPINYQFGISSSPQILDLDNDSDFEIIAGTSGDLLVIDVKETYEQDNLNSWSLFKGDWQRKGYYVYEESSMGGCGVPQIGDINCDEIINVIDIISMMNYILGVSPDYDEYQLWAADLTGDSVIDVVDIIAIVNLILDSWVGKWDC